MNLWNFGNKGPRYNRGKKFKYNWGFFLMAAAIIGAIILFVTK